MKGKVNIPVRGKSNPPMQPLQQSLLTSKGEILLQLLCLRKRQKKWQKQKLEASILKEMKLIELKQLMSQEAAKRESTLGSSNSKTRLVPDRLNLNNMGKPVIDGRQKLSGRLNKENVARNPSNQNRQPREKVPVGIANSTEMGILNQFGQTKEGKQFLVPPENYPKANTIAYSNGTKKIGIPTRGQIKVRESPRVQQSTTESTPKLSSQGDEVFEFLEGLSLQKYVDVFKLNGFDDLETILEIQTKHLVEMRIPAGHQIKIIKKIQKLRNEDPETQKQNLTDNTKYNSTPHTIPQENPLPRLTSATVSTKPIPDDPQKDSNEPQRAQSAKKKKVQFIEPQPSERKDPIESTEEGTGMSPRHGIKNLSCWLCFKLICEGESVQYAKRVFCSDMCQEYFIEQNSEICNNRTCKQLFLKNEGKLHKGIWYCSVACFPPPEEETKEPQISEPPEISDNYTDEPVDITDDEENQEYAEDIDLQMQTEEEGLDLDKLAEKYGDENKKEFVGGLDDSLDAR